MPNSHFLKLQLNSSNSSVIQISSSVKCEVIKLNQNYYLKTSNILKQSDFIKIHQNGKMIHNINFKLLFSRINRWARSLKIGNNTPEFFNNLIKRFFKTLCTNSLDDDFDHSKIALRVNKAVSNEKAINLLMSGEVFCVIQTVFALSNQLFFKNNLIVKGFENIILRIINMLRLLLRPEIKSKYFASVDVIEKIANLFNNQINSGHFILLVNKYSIFLNKFRVKNLFFNTDLSEMMMLDENKNLAIPAVFEALSQTICENIRHIFVIFTCGDYFLAKKILKKLQEYYYYSNGKATVEGYKAILSHFLYDIHSIVLSLKMLLCESLVPLYPYDFSEELSEEDCKYLFCNLPQENRALFGTILRICYECDKNKDATKIDFMNAILSFIHIYKLKDNSVNNIYSQAKKFAFLSLSGEIPSINPSKIPIRKHSSLNETQKGSKNGISLFFENLFEALYFKILFSNNSEISAENDYSKLEKYVENIASKNYIKNMRLKYCNLKNYAFEDLFKLLLTAISFSKTTNLYYDYIYFFASEKKIYQFKYENFSKTELWLKNKLDILIRNCSENYYERLLIALKK